MDFYQAHVFDWILKKNWKGYSDMEKIIEDFLPLYKEKYLHPFEKLNKDVVLGEMRENNRLHLPNIQIHVETDRGLERFKPIDISKTGISFMVTKNLNYFKRYNKHIAHITVEGEKLSVVLEFRHLTLINAKRPYYKFGAQFVEGHDKIVEILTKCEMH